MWMWRRIVVVAVGCVVLCAGSAAQTQTDKTQSPDNASSKAGQSTATAQTTTAQGAAADTMAQSDGEMSVAEAARLARANKKDPGEVVKRYDDDNFQRSVPIVKKNAAGAEGGSNAAAAAPSASLDELKGKVVLLDFWATWCGVCREALPKVKQLQTVYGGGDFVLVSVSEDEDQNAWRSFVAGHGMTWAQRFDGDSSLMNKYQVRALPTYVLLGRDGQEVQRYEGEDPAVSIVERIEPDLKNALEAR